MKHKRRRKLIKQGANSKMTRLHKLAIRGSVAQMEEHLAEIRRTMTTTKTTVAETQQEEGASFTPSKDFLQYLNRRAGYNGSTALELACFVPSKTKQQQRQEEPRIEVARLLIQAGADMHATLPDGSGMSVVDLACWRGSTLVLEMLFQEFGLNPNYTRARNSSHKKRRDTTNHHDITPPLAQLLAGVLCKVERKTLGEEEEDEYLECLEIITGHPLFDVTFHESLDIWHPIATCIGQIKDNEKDAMYEFLVVLLQRGFNPNGKFFSVCSYLQRAVEFGHEECAKALVLAGADIYDTAKYTRNAAATPNAAAEGTWTNSLEICGSNIGGKLDEELILYYNAVRAVSGIKHRRGLASRAPERLVSRTIATVGELKEFGRYAEATEALASIVLMVPRSAFTDKERYRSLHHLVGARFLNFEFRSAQTFTDIFIGEFREDLIPRLQYSCLLFHPRNVFRELTKEEIKWARIVAGVAEYQLEQQNYTLQFTDESSFNEDDIRAYVKCIQNGLKKHTQVSSGDVDVEQECYNLYTDGKYDKLVQVIGNTLHAPTGGNEMVVPQYNASYLQMLQAVANVERARDILNGFSSNSSGTPLRLGTECPVGYVGWAALKEKLELAIKGLDKYIQEEDGAYPANWVRFLSMVMLGEDDNLEEIAIEVMKKIREERRQIPKAPCMVRSLFPHPGLAKIGYFQQKLNDAFSERSIGIQLSLLDSLHSAVEEGKPSNQDIVSGASITNSLKEMLEDMSSLPLIRAEERESIQHYVDVGTLQESEVVDAWLGATSAIKQSEELAVSIRSALAQLTLEQDALPAHQKGKSARVVGILLNEAIAWDSNVFVPQELQGVQEKMAPPKRCDQCFVAGARHFCPCGEANYCSKECQVMAWKKHKKTCTTRRGRKSVSMELID